MPRGDGLRWLARYRFLGTFTTLARACPTSRSILTRHSAARCFSDRIKAADALKDPRFGDFGPILDNQFTTLQEQYSAPRNPIILAHGLFGFSELHLAGPKLPGISYWRGIVEALTAKGVDVFITDVPASGSIEIRAKALVEEIEKKAGGRNVNIIAHSMLGNGRGLDSRFMISRLKPTKFNVVSLTTIATPHHGSAFADYVFRRIGAMQLPRIYRALENFGLGTGAFSQLTQSYMKESFNPSVPDLDSVRYFAYGAAFKNPPPFLSLFRQSYYKVMEAEGPNDGLVSVESSRWGKYMGTLSGVSHLDLINWTNRLRWFLWEITGNKTHVISMAGVSSFNAIAFYLHISDMLAKEGL